MSKEHFNFKSIGLFLLSRQTFIFIALIGLMFVSIGFFSSKIFSLPIFIMVFTVIVFLLGLNIADRIKDLKTYHILILKNAQKLHNDGHYKKALHHYHKAMAIKPDHFDTLFGLGMVLKELVKLSEAEEYFLKTLNVKSDSAHAMFHLGITYYKLEKNQLAEKAFRKVLEMDPKLYASNYYLGEIIRRTGYLKEAVGYYRKYLEFCTNEKEIAKVQKILKEIDSETTKDG